MKRTAMYTCVSAAALAIGCATTPAFGADAAQPAAAAANSAPAAPEASQGTLDLQQIIVTGTVSSTTKMRSSISVSSLDSAQILANQPQNAADVLSGIPGLFVQSSGGGGNANVSVRGLPISAGGSRYVQFQEDGLPVLLFGDIAFGNSDDFIRIDNSVDRVEVVRGGTGSTLTTNGPGGIINFITKTGKEDGGSIGLTSGINYQDFRIDANDGGHIGDRTRYFIGGFYEGGTGPRNESAAKIEGGQVKANITHEFDNGYIRLNLKYLSDHQPMYLPEPVNIVGGTINTIPGIDPRKYTGYSPNLPIDAVVNNNNTLTNVNINNGMVTKSFAAGFEAHFDLGSGWVLDDKFRTATNSGQWAAWYPGSNVAAAPTDATFASGTNAGMPYSGRAFQNIAFDVNVKDLGATTNDIKLTNTVHNLGGGDLTFGAGFFLNEQHVNLVWNFNAYLVTANSQPAPLNSASSGITNGGFAGPGFGACCSRDYDGSYLTTSPYAFANYQNGGLSLDGSVREDIQKASGYYNIGVVAAGSPATTLPMYAQKNAVPIDYRLTHFAYSAGANYLIKRDIAVFLRYSDGSSFNADRIMDNGPLSGSSAYIPLNTVRQLEGGVKARVGKFSAFVTLFDARTSEFNYSNNFSVVSTSKYRGRGVELESGYHIGGFHADLGVTYTDSKVLASTTASFINAPENRQPKLIYQIGAGYTDAKFDVSLHAQGVSSSTETDNTAPNNHLPAYTIVNGQIGYNIGPRFSVSVGAYNLFNTLAYTELDGTDAARALNGRSVKAGVKYKF